MSRVQDRIWYVPKGYDLYPARALYHKAMFGKDDSVPGVLEVIERFLYAAGSRVYDGDMILTMERCNIIRLRLANTCTTILNGDSRKKLVISANYSIQERVRFRQEAIDKPPSAHAYACQQHDNDQYRRLSRNRVGNAHRFEPLLMKMSRRWFQRPDIDHGRHL
jgi:hypothetical protein